MIKEAVAQAQTLDSCELVCHFLTPTPVEYDRIRQLNFSKGPLTQLSTDCYTESPVEKTLIANTAGQYIDVDLKCPYNIKAIYYGVYVNTERATLTKNMEFVPVEKIELYANGKLIHDEDSRASALLDMGMKRGVTGSNSANRIGDQEALYKYDFALDPNEHLFNTGSVYGREMANFRMRIYMRYVPTACPLVSGAHTAFVFSEYWKTLTTLENGSVEVSA